MAYEFPNCVPCTSCGSMVPVAELTTLRADLESAAVRERVYQSRVEELKGEVERMRKALEAIVQHEDGAEHHEDCPAHACDGDCALQQDENGDCVEHDCECSMHARSIARAALTGKGGA